MSSTAKFLEGNLMRHVVVMTTAASVGLMAIFLVDLVDIFFISMLGNSAITAAVAYAGTILFFSTSIVIGMSIATSALVANALGAGDDNRARSSATSTALFGIPVSIIVSIFVLLNIEMLTGLTGATGESQRLAIEYLRIILPSNPILMIGLVSASVIRAHGNAKRSMYITLAGSAVNAVLDPILIFYFELGLSGAAYASVCARTTIAVLALYWSIKIHNGFAKPSYEQFLTSIKPIAIIAIPAVGTQLATPFGAAYVTRAMAEFGPNAVAGVAVVYRIMPVAIALVFALSGAIGPIIGQNVGANNYSRVRTTYNNGMIFVAVYILVVSILLFMFRNVIADAFGATGIARDIIILFCGPLALLYFFNGVLFVSNAAFNNLGYPVYSTTLNWLRHTAGTIPFVIIGANWYGATGVLAGQYVGGVVFGLLAWYIGYRVIDKKERLYLSKS